MARHTFPPPADNSTSDSHGRTTAQPPPPQATPPSDPALASAIEGMAAFVARSGPELERLAREKHRGEALFEFLEGKGPGGAYYQWRLWHHRNLLRLTGRPPEPAREGGKEESSCAKAGAPQWDAERRREVLGEKALAVSSDASSVPAPASRGVRSAHTPPQEGRGQSSSAAPAAAPSPAAAELAALMAQRFQSAGVEVSTTMLVPPGSDGYLGPQGRFTGTSLGGGRLAAYQTRPALPFVSSMSVPVTTGLVRCLASCAFFTLVCPSLCACLSPQGSSGAKAGGAAASAPAGTSGPAPGSVSAVAPARRLADPKRTEESWRPMPLVCKRFNIPDPYAGRVSIDT